jgi:diaminopimelate decarboxylase
LSWPHFPELAFLDLGGGFKVPIKRMKKAPILTIAGQRRLQALSQNAGSKAYNRDFQAWFEPGKFLVSECGYFITQVNVMKQAPVPCSQG